ncbi:MAG: L-glutamate gamma-semialdehyde dehydrogenase [Planctomycetes bacterium]|nr:L-glutamate gamma-semialdehyde dehydrogenase [Planctomycetota bacterium]
MRMPFVNEPITYTWNEDRTKAIKKGFVQVRERAGEIRPLWLGGEPDNDGEILESFNPSNKTESLGKTILGNKDLANRAVEKAYDVFQNYWRKTDVGLRARILHRTAGLIRSKYRDEFNAYLILESGKSWTEADADTAECIDFLEFYAREAMDLQGKPQPIVPLEGEDNNYYWIPIGPVAAIPPWNFPLAIMAGLTCAPLVMGNTVVLKPAPDTTLVAMRFVEVLHEAGLPKQVLQVIPGDAEVGEAIVTHAKTRAIAFTGSKAVGKGISEKAGSFAVGQIWIKRAILEMGGKDAMLIDEGSDYDDAAQAIVAAAFGFAGQKCSACSRAIFVGEAYDKTVPKIVELTNALKTGPVEDASNFVGPLINQKSVDKVKQYVAYGTKEGKLLAGGKPGDDSGHYWMPTVFGEVTPDARIHMEEIFGPVLACLRAKDFQAGLDIVNSTEYGLTGAVYSPNAEHLELARRDFHVGNLYLNRKCTGALVGSQPFGGFNMSGTDSKAGSREYMYLFAQAKLVSEKTNWA